MGPVRFGIFKRKYNEYIILLDTSLPLTSYVAITAKENATCLKSKRDCPICRRLTHCDRELLTNNKQKTAFVAEIVNVFRVLLPNSTRGIFESSICTLECNSKKPLKFWEKSIYKLSEARGKYYIAHAADKKEVQLKDRYSKMFSCVE